MTAGYCTRGRRWKLTSGEAGASSCCASGSGGVSVNTTTEVARVSACRASGRASSRRRHWRSRAASRGAVLATARAQRKPAPCALREERALGRRRATATCRACSNVMRPRRLC